ncbi:hypothetical protein HETIRDRAFT_455635 [Heterobasidion irregulare TC 32-1]|uniref:Uncharacterized protein n=1 Tax=Heterobasidion irregulare (strain TC 32-1) TaxID=747525 RepID=W4JR66_HETIT|nr:uncharacterized protein HETIRDRAFT_455635 [Heterobasidion irregulare TC 32-1]ETW76033.1 hypothetical protein HETIRDRAFT_455635 [Heterobasidion irregulare TC 32-1]
MRAARGQNSGASDEGARARRYSHRSSQRRRSSRCRAMHATKAAPDQRSRVVIANSAVERSPQKQRRRRRPHTQIDEPHPSAPPRPTPALSNPTRASRITHHVPLARYKNPPAPHPPVPQLISRDAPYCPPARSSHRAGAYCTSQTNG